MNWLLDKNLRPPFGLLSLFTQYSVSQSLNNIIYCLCSCHYDFQFELLLTLSSLSLSIYQAVYFWLVERSLSIPRAMYLVTRVYLGPCIRFPEYTLGHVFASFTIALSHYAFSHHKMLSCQYTIRLHTVHSGFNFHKYNRLLNSWYTVLARFPTSFIVHLSLECVHCCFSTKSEPLHNVNPLHMLECY